MFLAQFYAHLKTPLFYMLPFITEKISLGTISSPLFQFKKTCGLYQILHPVIEQISTVETLNLNHSSRSITGTSNRKFLLEAFLLARHKSN